MPNLKLEIEIRRREEEGGRRKEEGRTEGRNGRNAKRLSENSFKPILIFRPMIFSGRRRSGRSLRPSAAPWPSFRYAPDLNGSLDRRRSPRISLAIIIRGNFEWWNPPRPPPLTLFDIELATRTFERGRRRGRGRGRGKGGGSLSLECAPSH